MQVQLKQSEIEAALKGYLAQQGINLTNKTITCVFTAGRKDSGVSVELEIEEQPVSVSGGCATTKVASVPTTPVIALQAQTTAPVEEAAPVVPPTSSLFA